MDMELLREAITLQKLFICTKTKIYKTNSLRIYSDIDTE